MYSSHVIVLGDGGVSDCRLTGCSEKQVIAVYLSMYSLRILLFNRCTRFAADTSHGFSIPYSSFHRLHLDITPQTAIYTKAGCFNALVNQLIQEPE